MGKLNNKAKLVKYKRANGTHGYKTVLEGKTMTQINQQEDTDVNKILAKYIKTGSITHIRNQQDGVYSDLVNQPSYLEAMDTVAKGNQAFEAMPPNLRNKFDNDPHKLISYLEDPKNEQESIELGLRHRRPSEETEDHKKSKLETEKVEEPNPPTAT